MTGIFAGLEIARRALLTHQTAVQVAGHNLANTATPGYTRQRAELVPLAPMAGVDVAAVRRVQDRYLDFALLSEIQRLGQAEAAETLLGRLETVFNDSPEASLGALLDGLFQGFQALAAVPTDLPLRVTLRDRALRLAAAFRTLWARVEQIRADLVAEVQRQVAEVNRLTSAITDLHRRILAAPQGSPPNDLLDRRDQLVTELARIVGLRVTDRADGTVQLTVDGSGILLVDGPLAARVTAESTPERLEVSVGGVRLDPDAGVPASGALAALLGAGAGAVQRTLDALDALARTLIAEANRLHATGGGLSAHTSLASTYPAADPAAPLGAATLEPFGSAIEDGTIRVIVYDGSGEPVRDLTITVRAGSTTLEDIRSALDADPALTAMLDATGRLAVTAAGGASFVFAEDTSGVLMALGLNPFFTGTGARDLAVAEGIATDVRTIAAARVDETTGRLHPGNGANALALARLRSEARTAEGTTLGDGYAALVATRGSEAREASAARERQQSAVQAVWALQQQVAAVSPDEEILALTQSQQAYAAAARYVGVLQELLDSLLHMVR